MKLGSMLNKIKKTVCKNVNRFLRYSYLKNCIFRRRRAILSAPTVFSYSGTKFHSVCLAKTHSENLFKHLHHSSYSVGEQSFIFSTLWRHTVSFLISEMAQSFFPRIFGEAAKKSDTILWTAYCTL